MRHILQSVAVVALALPGAALACEGMQHQASYEPRRATVAEVATWTKEKQATAVDANGEKTRTSQGVIPGAVLLTSSASYSLSELPKDRASKLVFYCANEKCTASLTAAQRALDHGYTDVSVLPAGISGWRQAGQPTAKPNS